MHTCSQSPRIVEEFGCALQHIAQDALCFLIFTSFLPKTSGYWQDSYLVVIYFVKTLHVTCSTLKLVMYSWNVEMVLQNFVLFVYILVMHLEIEKIGLIGWLYMMQL